MGDPEHLSLIYAKEEKFISIDTFQVLLLPGDNRIRIDTVLTHRGRIQSGRRSQFDFLSGSE